MLLPQFIIIITIIISDNNFSLWCKFWMGIVSPSLGRRGGHRWFSAAKYLSKLWQTECEYVCVNFNAISNIAQSKVAFTPVLRSLQRWLNINECIEWKPLSLTYKILTTSQLDYLHNLISVWSTCRTRSSFSVTLARPSVSSSLQITNCSFKYALPYLWNQLPSFRQPHSVHSPPGSLSCTYHLITDTTFAVTTVTPSVFHSRLKTYLFHESFFLILSVSGRHLWILNLYWTNWALAFYCFSFVC